MTNTTYTQFKLVDDFSQNTVINEIESNLKLWFDWCLLGIGAWNDVEIPTSGYYGVYHTLRVVNDDAYADGQVWEGVRKDWVWETGVEFDDDGDNPDPIQITGVVVDGIGYTSDDATYGWHINYPLGRVVFDSAIATNSTVQVEHSYRYVQVYKADSVPWFREFQFASLKPNDNYFQQIGSGNWVVGGNHRIQLPTIVIEAVSRGDTRPYELGNGALVIEQDVLFHIFAENRYDRNNLLDVCRFQADKTIWLMNTNTLITNGAFPLDYRGMLTGTNMYPDLVQDSTYQWRKCRFVDNHISYIESIHPHLYEGVVRSTLEVVLGNI